MTHPSITTRQANLLLQANLFRHLVFCVLIVASFVAGVALRSAAMSEPVWLDELHTAWCVCDSPGEVLPRAVMGNQSPLFFWLEYAAFHGLGKNEVALRCLPLIASLGLLVSIPWVVYRLSGSLVGAWLAMTLAAFDDSFIYYAVEARPYGLVQLVSVWQVVCFLNFLKSYWPVDPEVPSQQESANPVWLVMLSVALFYLHLTTILLLAAELVFLLGLSFVNRKTEFRLSRIWAPAACALTLCLPGIYLLMRIGENRTDWQSIAAEEFYGLMMVAHLAIYALVPALTGFCYRAGRSLNRWLRLRLILLALLVLLPVAFCFLGSIFQFAPLAHYRYSIASSTVLVVLSGAMFGVIHSRKRKLVAAAIVLFLAVATNPLAAPWFESGTIPAQRNEDWKNAVSIIREDFMPVIVFPNLVEDEPFSGRPSEAMEAYYRFSVTGLYQFADAQENEALIKGCSMLSTNPVSEVDVGMLERYGGCWLIVRARTGDALAISRMLEDQLKDSYVSVIVERWTDSPVNLFRVTIR